MSLHRRLLNLYGSGKIQEVEETDQFRQLCKDRGGDEGFEPERQRIRQLKNTLEELLADQRHCVQVKLCLIVLSQTKDEEKRADYHALIKLAYWPNWSSAQKAHYDNSNTVISGNVYYFLSFTSQNGTPERVNFVNSNHRYFIEDVFWRNEILKTANLIKQNMLAEAVRYFVVGHGLKGFYYPSHEGNSEFVEAKLRDNCEKMLTFVQLVQLIMFEWKPKNFCQFEYQEALNSPACRKRIFVLADERQDLVNMGPVIGQPYIPWYSEAIEEKDALQLTPTPARDDAIIQENRKKIKEQIVREIVKVRNAMFGDVPED